MRAQAPPCRSVRSTVLTRPAARPAVQRRLRCWCTAAAVVTVDDAKQLLEREGYTVLDVRPAREYDDSHITKPARCSVNVPLAGSSQQFAAQVASKIPSLAAKLIVACKDGGAASDQALQALEGARYTTLLKLEGGYTGWTAVWAPSGKRRPPPGRWVSTGKEALKSGLNIPGVAESYDEGGNLRSARWAQGFRDGESPLM